LPAAIIFIHRRRPPSPVNTTDHHHLWPSLQEKEKEKKAKKIFAFPKGILLKNYHSSKSRK
jgi:hypothetical protein